MAKSRKPAQKKRDQTLIAEYYLHGDTQHAIAQRLKTEHNIQISQVTVHRDLKEIQKRWLQETNINIDEIKIVQLRKIDAVESEFWKGWNQSQGEMKKEITKIDGKSKETQVQKWELNGDPRFLFGILSCIERRCKILGIEAAEGNVFLNVTFAQFVKQHFSGNGKLK